MRIANIMLGKARGGLEQCVVDYAEALTDGSNGVLTVVDPNSPLLPTLRRLAVKTVTFKQRGQWDIFAAWRLRKILKDADIDVAICHGNRAFRLTKQAYKKRPTVYVTHNDRLKSVKNAYAVFATGDDLFDKAEQVGFCPDEDLFLIPNMARLPMQKPPAQRFASPIIIGFLGRLHKCKGLDILLRAAAELKSRPNAPDFQLLIAGDGPERKNLIKLARKLDIASRVEFTGWIDDKPAFFRKIDIFCLPSLSEAFGIVLLEAMGAGAPVIASACSGPSQILEHNTHALMVPPGDEDMLADAVEKMSAMSTDALGAMTQAAFDRAAEYNLPNVGHKLNAALKIVCTNARASRR